MSASNDRREVLSMDVDPEDSTESEFRILLGDEIKYIIVEPGTYDPSMMSFPADFLVQLPELPAGSWRKAVISRHKNDALSVRISTTDLARVREPWHPSTVDVLSLPLTPEKRFGARVRVYRYESRLVVAKIARFEFEMPLIEKETSIYRAIHGKGVAPAFLGHLAEHGRIMGFLIELVEGRIAGIEDLEACKVAARRLHSLGIVHGDLNRHNFVVSATGPVKLIDFENANLNGSKEAMEEELSQLNEQLTEETRRGYCYVSGSDDSNS